MNFTRGLSLGQKVGYHVLYRLVYVLSLLPLRALYVLSDTLYPVVYHLVRYRRHIVRNNLTASFPEKTQAEIRTVERRFYHWLCDYAVETLKVASISEKQMMRRMQFTNMQVINSAFMEGHNVALYLGHYCNWEWITSIILHVPKEAAGGQVYRPLKNRTMDRLLLRLRTRWRTECIPKHLILRRIVEERNKGRRMITGFLSDQRPKWDSIHHWVDFLCHDTPVLTGTERLAKKYDFTCVYLDISRPRRGHYVAEAKLLAANPQDCADWEITDLYFKALEESVRKQPEFYLWTHNRWKRTREEYNRLLDPATGKLKLQ